VSQQGFVQGLPDAGLIPFLEPPPYSHARATAQFAARESAIRASLPQQVEEGGETVAVRDAGPPTLGGGRMRWQERLNLSPQRFWQEIGTHGSSSERARTSFLRSKRDASIETAS
jgi:hypothetical protein